ncbi:tRNA (guanine26-N2/guanine27-N2)-dimethyltransferase [Dendrobium catenatum]|uniref:tRNA (Guanine26-N2/guanine27-N2)-dimethyltransferase n=1 Tax=Dendrobium catenatum TaxID=906689 RepID=A0A2I0W056_9ASPA|nr:tRNA (guanine26-N2/guanine27-N2)-dimethyltransferase [Dendrobium catenatum]
MSWIPPARSLAPCQSRILHPKVVSPSPSRSTSRPTTASCTYDLPRLLALLALHGRTRSPVTCHPRARPHVPHPLLAPVTCLTRTRPRVSHPLPALAAFLASAQPHARSLALRLSQRVGPTWVWGGSLSSYGAYVRPMPYSNEVGLRMLIGGASREAAASGFLVSPLFSYYSYHGPVFRVMLQVFRGNLNDSSNYGFISYCNQCGNSQTHRWAELGQISCPCRNGMVSHSVVVSGPLWTGPLHNTAYVSKMLELAREWGWACNSKKCSDVENILNQMIDESDPQLPSGYIKLDEIASRAKINSPPLSAILSALRKKTILTSIGSVIYKYKNYKLGTSIVK